MQVSLLKLDFINGLKLVILLLERCNLESRGALRNWINSRLWILRSWRLSNKSFGKVHDRMVRVIVWLGIWFKLLSGYYGKWLNLSINGSNDWFWIINDLLLVHMFECMLLVVYLFSFWVMLLLIVYYSGGIVLFYVINIS